MKYKSLWPTLSLRSNSGHVSSFIPNFHVAFEGTRQNYWIMKYMSKRYIFIMRLKIGLHDSLSHAIIFIHQTIFKKYGKITGPWNRGHSEAWMHGRTDERMERRKLYTPRHTSYAGDIITGPWNIGHSDPLLVWSQASSHIDSLAKGIMFIHEIVFKI